MEVWSLGAWALGLRKSWKSLLDLRLGEGIFRLLTFWVEIKLVSQIEATESYVRLLQRGPQQPSSEGGLCFNNSLMTLTSVPTTFNPNGPNVEAHAAAGPGSSTCCIPHATPPLNVPTAQSRNTHSCLQFLLKPHRRLTLN